MMFESKKLYLTILGVIVAALGICALLSFASIKSMRYGTSIPSNSTFASLPTQVSGINATVHNLPIQVSLSQTRQLEKYISNQASNTPKDSPVVGYFRDGTISYESNGVAFLVDVPAIKQSLSVTTFDDGASSIGCASESDRQDMSWVCVEENLDE